jgi:hypothetical protein
MELYVTEGIPLAVDAFTDFLEWSGASQALGGLLAEIRGAAAWIALAALGLVLVVAAAVMERGRAAARTAVTRARELVKDWE